MGTRAERMDLYEVMRTTFAARDFLPDKVSDTQIHRILDNARFAPSGGNRQGWRVVVVRDASMRRKLGELIEPTMQRYVAQVKAGEAPFNTVHPSQVTDAEVAATQPPASMIDNLTQAPVILMVFVDLSVVASFDHDARYAGVISGASVYPFVWNILLAARNEGLGGTLTTFVGGQAAALHELFSVPEGWAFAAMLPMGKPVKQLTKLKRKPVSEFTYQDTFVGPQLQIEPDAV